MNRLRTRQIVKTGFALLVCGGVMVGCAPRTAVHGNMPEIDRIQLLKPGETTKNQVQQFLGSPSSMNMFGDETWVYVGETTETLAFFESDITERSVVIVTFDKKGVVSDVNAHGMDQARKIEPVERITPTVGKKLTVIDQLVGNLNRYKSGSK